MDIPVEPWTPGDRSSAATGGGEFCSTCGCEIRQMLAFNSTRGASTPGGGGSRRGSRRRRAPFRGSPAAGSFTEGHSDTLGFGESVLGAAAAPPVTRPFNGRSHASGRQRRGASRGGGPQDQQQPHVRHHHHLHVNSPAAPELNPSPSLRKRREAAAAGSAGAGEGDHDGDGRDLSPSSSSYVPPLIRTEADGAKSASLAPLTAGESGPALREAMRVAAQHEHAKKLGAARRRAVRARPVPKYILERKREIARAGRRDSDFMYRVVPYTPEPDEAEEQGNGGYRGNSSSNINIADAADLEEEEAPLRAGRAVRDHTSGGSSGDSPGTAKRLSTLSGSLLPHVPPPTSSLVSMSFVDYDPDAVPMIDVSRLPSAMPSRAASPDGSGKTANDASLGAPRLSTILELPTGDHRGGRGSSDSGARPGKGREGSQESLGMGPVVEDARAVSNMFTSRSLIDLSGKVGSDEDGGGSGDGAEAANQTGIVLPGTSDHDGDGDDRSDGDNAARPTRRGGRRAGAIGVTAPSEAALSLQVPQAAGAGTRQGSSGSDMASPVKARRIRTNVSNSGPASGVKVFENPDRSMTVLYPEDDTVRELRELREQLSLAPTNSATHYGHMRRRNSMGGANPDYEAKMNVLIARRKELVRQLEAAKRAKDREKQQQLFDLERQQIAEMQQIGGPSVTAGGTISSGSFTAGSVIGRVESGQHLPGPLRFGQARPAAPRGHGARMAPTSRDLERLEELILLARRKHLQSLGSDPLGMDDGEIARELEGVLSGRAGVGVMDKRSLAGRETLVQSLAVEGKVKHALIDVRRRGDDTLPVPTHVSLAAPSGRVFFFAYDSLMSNAEMRRAVGHEIEARSWGVIFGHSFRFGKAGYARSAGSFPNLVPEANASAEGIVYLLNDWDIKVLEGLYSVPKHYERAKRIAWVTPDVNDPIAKQTVEVITLVAASRYTLPEAEIPSLPPSQSVANDVVRAASEGLTSAYVQHIAKLGGGTVTAAPAVPRLLARRRSMRFLQPSTGEYLRAAGKEEAPKVTPNPLGRNRVVEHKVLPAAQAVPEFKPEQERDPLNIPAPKLRHRRRNSVASSAAK